ncbi:MAG: DUF1704 domain-containing protein [Polyangiaceae bacterium]
MNVEVARCSDAIRAAEQRIALLDWVRPLNFASEVERLVVAFEAGRTASPKFRYAPPPDFTKLRQGLGLIVRESSLFGAWAQWIEGRVEELDLEAAIVQSVGTPALAGLAARRFPAPEGSTSGATNHLVERWLSADSGGECASAAPEDHHRSDDTRDPSSLVSVIRARLTELALDVDVVLHADMPSVAATSAEALHVRKGANLTLAEARRIAEHEIRAHLLPRRHARRARGLLRCGCARAGAEEEGRAVLVEARGGGLDGRRRRELALRHLACALSRCGASLVEVIRRLMQFGSSPRLAVTTGLRCFRGAPGDGAVSGLGREIVYLPAFIELRSAFEVDAALERWFERGRCSLAYARELENRPDWVAFELGEVAPP